MTLQAHVSETAAPADGTNCLHCPTRRSCLACDLDSPAVDSWGRLVQDIVNLPAGKALFGTGAPAQAVYSVRAGCIKTFSLDAEGQERVRGFHLAGDIVGLDALTQERYPMHAVAVAPTQVCVLPRSQMRHFAEQTPALNNRLVENLSHSLRSALSLAGDHTAEQRVAAFLLQRQGRLAPLAGRPMRLPMGRRDIANYLRLATETVCRVLTRFEQRGDIEVQDRQIRLMRPEALRAIADALSFEPMRAAA